MLRNSLDSLVKCESKARMIGRMAQITSYFPSPFLLFDWLSLPLREIAAPSLFERARVATALTTRFFSFFHCDVGDCGLTFGLWWDLNEFIYLGLTATTVPSGILHSALLCWRSWPSYRTGHDAVVSWIFGTGDNAWARWSNPWTQRTFVARRWKWR